MQRGRLTFLAGAVLWGAAVALAWGVGWAGGVVACGWAAACVLIVRPLVGWILRRVRAQHGGRVPGGRAAAVTFALTAAVVVAARSGWLDRWAPAPSPGERLELEQRKARDRAILRSIAEHLNRRGEESP